MCDNDVAAPHPNVTPLEVILEKFTIRQLEGLYWVLWDDVTARFKIEQVILEKRIRKERI